MSAFRTVPDPDIAIVGNGLPFCENKIGKPGKNLAPIQMVSTHAACACAAQEPHSPV
jgi:hypothetical protein